MHHPDIGDFLVAKDWGHLVIPGTSTTIKDVKERDFNFPAPLDMTNISVNYDTKWLKMEGNNVLDCYEVGRWDDEVFLKNVEQALSTGEPGFSFNFHEKEHETLRNACTEVTSEDDSDVCNLGSINLANISDQIELGDVVRLATKFLVCGTLVSDLPYEKVYDVRSKNRRLGLGLMGLHEWLIQRGHDYVVPSELRSWLARWEIESDATAHAFCRALGISNPRGCRAVAPTGTIGLIAGTTTGIEPLYAVAYRRRYLKNGTEWHYQYVVDSVAQEMIDRYDIHPDDISSALDLAENPKARIDFQVVVQEYTDHAISSTINLPAWGSKHNNPDTVEPFAMMLANAAPKLRGFTCYPDGARGGQPLTRVDYRDAVGHLGQEFREHVETHDVCSLTGHGGVCGI